MGGCGVGRRGDCGGQGGEAGVGRGGGSQGGEAAERRAGSRTMHRYCLISAVPRRRPATYSHPHATPYHTLIATKIPPTQQSFAGHNLMNLLI